MNLNDVLNNYKTTPENEMRKIEEILKARSFYYDGRCTLIEIARDVFVLSKYSGYETSFDNFYLNIVLNDDNFVGLDEKEKELVAYLMYSEFLLNVLVNNKNTRVSNSVLQTIRHLVSVITEGLSKLGYEINEMDGAYYTKKVNSVAEVAATNNHSYSDDIFTYLVSKTIVDKENALIRISNKLNAEKKCYGYFKQNKKYAQILRHKEEKVKDPDFSWFYKVEDYNKNLDKLFEIFISMISYNNSFEIVEEFEKKCGRKEKQ